MGNYCSDPWLICSSLGPLSLLKGVCTSIGPAWSDPGLLPSLLPGPGSSHLGPQWEPQGLDRARFPAACPPPWSLGSSFLCSILAGKAHVTTRVSVMASGTQWVVLPNSCSGGPHLPTLQGPFFLAT